MPFDARRVFTLALALLCSVAVKAADDPKPDTLVGTWSGRLDAGGAHLRCVVTIKPAADGGLAGTMDSPDQGARDIPLTDVHREGDVVEFKMPAGAARFSGHLDANGDRIVGSWLQSGQTLPLTLQRDAQAATAAAPKPRRPQQPQPPYPYVQEDVSYPNAEAGITLAGTLTRPKTGGPFPAVVLLSGSGAQTRDSIVMGHALFLVLADHLTRAGIAVLRVDDRGIGQSTGDFAKATTADFASDAVAGIQFLKTRRDIDRHRIGLYGHSEGALEAPMAAVRSKDVAFLVLVGTPGLPLDAIILRQAELIGQASGIGADVLAKDNALQEKLFAVVRQEPDDARAADKLRTLMAPPKDNADASAAADAQIRVLLSPWFRFALAHDPRPVLRNVHVPVLAIGGEKDLQVPRENLELVRAALVAGGNKHVKTVELPGLNHLLQPCQTGSPAEYGTIEETMAPDALKLIARWILAQG